MEQTTPTKDTTVTDNVPVQETDSTSQSAKPDMFDFYDRFYNA